MTGISPHMALITGQLDDLARQIAEEEAKLWNDIQRMQARIRDIEREIYDRKHEHLMRIRPLRQQHEAIVNQIARSQALTPTIFIKRENEQ